MDLQLSNKVILVTGGASGIGAAISLGLAAEGAIPVILGKSPMGAEFAAALHARANRTSNEIESAATRSSCCASCVRPATRRSRSSRHSRKSSAVVCFFLLGGSHSWGLDVACAKQQQQQRALCAAERSPRTQCTTHAPLPCGR